MLNLRQLLFPNRPSSAVELHRYQERYKELLEHQHTASYYYSSIPSDLLQPHEHYIESLNTYIKPTSSVLELGAGNGLHTQYLLHAQTVYATDLSENSLSMIQSLYPHAHNLFTPIVDIQSMPFPDDSFDIQPVF
jgi:SAM-dependent methyltransferase